MVRTWLICAFLALPLTAEEARKIAVIAHRGEHLRHAENTVSAYRAAFDAGADFIEVDIRTTSDGRLVLMHDATIDRTTKGHGAVADMTFDAMRTLGVPTLEEALELATGSRGVYLDCKQVAPRALIDAVAQHRMQDGVVVYGRPDFLRQVHTLEARLKIMPEAGTPERLRALIGSLALRIAAFDAHDFDDETISVAKSAKLDIYVDRLGADDTPAGWEDAIRRGATGIQTDYPAELVQFLSARKRSPR